MFNLNWIYNLFSDIPIKDDEKKVIIQFWNEFYTNLYKNTKMSEQEEKTKSVQYKEEVFELLHKNKANFPLRDDELRNLQITIEDHTLLFEEESMFKTAPNIIRLLIRDKEVNAKDYLRSMELEKDDIELISEFGQYTIEALIVHVLGMVFNTVESSAMIRVASLVERLESSVRIQGLLLKSRRIQNKLSIDNDNIKESGTVRKRSKLEKKYPFGSGLVQFMEERGLIKLIHDSSGSVRANKKKGHYYLPCNLYAICLFDLSLLPIKLNLPMVYPPQNWRSACPPGERPNTLSDLSGGYLSGPTGDIYDRYRLLSTGDINNFYIDIGRDDNYKTLCEIMNKLQSQCFKINSDWLKFIQDNEALLVENNLLMPKFLASMNINDVSNLLRKLYMKDDAIKKLSSFNDMLSTLFKNIQRARYEQLIIKLAIAYDGYHFYLPAFLDFRGRIYRCGILHFHERDLARSLIVFADHKSSTINNIDKKTFIAATSFHYKSFVTVEESLDWFYNNASEISDNPIEYARDAKRPFQFLANIIGTTQDMDHILTSIPITQDASASAYQIMSYLLLDEAMAMKTNLIPSPDGKIQDVYSFFLEELKEFMKAELDNNLSTIVCSLLTRKLVKGIYMPIIYGKTLMSTAHDLKEHLSYFITHKECFDVASVCFKFWKMKFPGMNSLIRLIRNIGWIASARDFPVFYRVPEFTTVQDYMIMEPINIWVYDKLHKKRRQVTLRVSTSKRDRRKSESQLS